MSAKAGEALADARTGKNGRHALVGMLRQSVFGRLAGYEDVNDAERLRHDPALRWIIGGKAAKGRAASPSQMGRFETRWLADPAAAQARRFEEQGFEYLHVVDLDGAFAGQPMNAAAVERILASVKLKVQLGGGVRDMRTVAGWLEKGVERVIIGTAALKDPDFVREASRLFPGHVAVGIDAREGRVAVEGWARQSDTSALDLGRIFEDSGVCAIIYTDIARDGVMQGLNIVADGRARRGAHHPRDRLGRARLDRRHPAAAGARLRKARRRDLGPRVV